MIDWRWILKYRILHHAPTEWPEKEVVQVVAASKGNLFIDIGSNRGFYSKLAKKTFRKVVSIEPDRRWGYNHPLRVALSSRKGKMPIFKTVGDAGILTLNRDFHVHGHSLPTALAGEIDTIAYDDLRLDADLVKIDVEGAELDILDGMNKYLPNQIIVELHDERRAEELCNKLAEKGYDVENITAYHYLAKKNNGMDRMFL